MMNARDPKRRDDAYLVKWNKKYRTVKTHDREFIPRKQKSKEWVPDILDRGK